MVAQVKVYWSWPMELCYVQFRQPTTCGDMPREKAPNGRTLMCIQPNGPLHGENHRCVFKDGEVWEWRS